MPQTGFATREPADPGNKHRPPRSAWLSSPLDTHGRRPRSCWASQKKRSQVSSNGKARRRNYPYRIFIIVVFNTAHQTSRDYLPGVEVIVHVVEQNVNGIVQGVFSAASKSVRLERLAWSETRSMKDTWVIVTQRDAAHPDSDAREGCRSTNVRTRRRQHVPPGRRRRPPVLDMKGKYNYLRHKS